MYTLYKINLQILQRKMIDFTLADLLGLWNYTGIDAAEF